MITWSTLCEDVPRLRLLDRNWRMMMILIIIIIIMTAFWLVAAIDIHHQTHTHSHTHAHTSPLMLEKSYTNAWILIRTCPLYIYIYIYIKHKTLNHTTIYNLVKALWGKQHPYQLRLTINTSSLYHNLVTASLITERKDK